MSRKTIKYIGFYDFSNSSSMRVCSLAATNKMDYIASSLVKAGYKVQFISPSWTANCKGWYKKRTSDIANGITLTVGPTFGANDWIMRKFRIGWSWLWLFCYLVCNVKRGEKVLAYHSLMMDFPLYCAKLIKRFKLVLEVEEIYGKVWGNKNILNIMETKLINSADDYILVSDLLAKTLKITKYVRLYGGYPQIAGETTCYNQNGHVNIVYAGSIDTTKGGASNIVKAAKYLNKNYIIHILGFGNKEQIRELEQQIVRINNNLKREACLYHGIKTGRELTKFLHLCQIGVNSQVIGDYMNTAFPSKVLTYLSHNLKVVSTPVKSILQSTLSDMINFADSDTPEAIAKAIMAIAFNKPYDSTKRIKELDEQFVIDIKTMLEE